MKKQLLFLLVLAALFFSRTSFGQGCVCSSMWPTTPVTPTTAWTTINTLMYAGDYAVVNVVAGNTYEFTTCAIYGSNVTYDSELTLLTNAQQYIAYNDDFCGTQSYISWTATYTGTVQIHLTEYYLGSGCWTNLTSSSIRYRYTAGALAVPPNNACASATPMTPSVNCNLLSGNTLGATEDPYLDPSCDLAGVYNDVWYSFNTGAYNSVNLTVNLGTATLVGVEIYTSCGVLAPGLSLGGSPGNCDFNTNAPNPTVITGLTPNTNYLLRLFTNASYDVPGTFTACLTVPPPPTVTVNSTGICAGQSVTLTASPSAVGGTYLWSNGATTQSITVTPNTTTTYSVTYSNNGTANGSGTVTVNPLPNINGGQDQTVCQGATVTLNATGGSTYTWDNGVTNGFPFVPNATTTYTVTGTDVNGCQANDQVIVTVNPSPLANTVMNQTLCAGASTTLVSFSGTPGATFNWTNNAPNIGLANSGTGNIAAFTATNSTGNPITANITVTPILAGCSGTPQTFTYTVNPTPVAPNASNVSICNGQTATITASSLANWYTVPTGGVTIGQALAYTTPALNATTTYYMEGVSGPCVSPTRNAVTVTVNPTPSITGNTVICPNTSSQLTGSGIAAPNSPWTSSNPAFATVSNTGLVSAIAFGTTTITYTANTGCSITTIVNVTNPATPTFNPIAAVCSGGNIQLPVTSTNNIQGTWSPAINNTQTTNYTFTPAAGQCATTAQLNVAVNPNPTISGGNSLCANATLQLSGSGTPNANNPWMSGSVNVANISGTGLVSGLNAGTSTITYTDNNGCSTTQNITVNAPPTVTGNTVICPNSNSQLTGSGVAASWTSSNPLIASVSNSGLVSALSFGTSTITYTATTGCSTTILINVTTPTAPTFNAISAVCSGGNIQLPTSSTNNIQGTWSPAVNNTQTTTYTFTPTVGQCATTAQMSVTVNPNPTISGGNALCPGANVQLTGNGTAAANNAWTSSNPANATISNTGLVTGLQAGNTTVTYTNNNGCVATQVVTVNANPVANAGLDQTLCAGGNVTLTGTGTGGVAPYVITWNNGVQNGVPFILNTTGTYTLTVTDNNGCSSIDNVTLTTQSIDWANLQWPVSGVMCLGQTHNVYGQIYMAGVTNAPGQAAGITAQIGVNSTNSNPNSWAISAWSNANFNAQVGNNDEYMAGIGQLLSAGTYYYAFRYSLGQGCPYYYGGFNGGAWDGTNNTSGTLTINNAPNATSNQSACGSYTWQGQTYTQSGTYTHTVPSGAGCDSVLYLNLTIHNDVTGPTTQQNACESYTWNGQTYTQSGTYTYNGTTQFGCDSTATLDLTINQAPSNIQVTLTQGTFTVTAQDASSFAWMDCASGNLIPGETSSSFTPLISGSYAAIANNNCGADTSNCEPIEVEGIDEGGTDQISLFPNPSMGKITLESKGAKIDVISIYDLKGELIFYKSCDLNQVWLDISEYAYGTYIIKVETQLQNQVFRLIKQ